MGGRQELVVEETPAPSAEAEIDQWARELDDAISRVPLDEDERFGNALIEIEKESKELARRQWQNEEGKIR